jgi:peptidoglycan/xylan/chitin deacetylase (PgdA/CDA1 family)
VIGHRRDPEVEAECLHVRDFRSLLQVVRKSFRVVSLDELVAALIEGRELGPRTLVITFDDGYANNAEVAAPILEEMRLPWSVFLPAMLIEENRRQWTDDLRVLIHRGSCRRLRLQWLEHDLRLDLETPAQRRDAFVHLQDLWRYADDEQRRPGLEQFYAHYSEDEIQTLRAEYKAFAPMTWDQARQLKSAGVGIGNHSLNHLPLGHQPERVIRREIEGGRQLLNARIGAHLPHFSYPYGRQTSVTATTERVLAELGYQSAMTLEQNVVTAASSLLRLPRLIVAPQLGRNLFTLWQRFIR